MKALELRIYKAGELFFLPQALKFFIHEIVVCFACVRIASVNFYLFFGFKNLIIFIFYFLT